MAHTNRSISVPIPLAEASRTTDPVPIPGLPGAYVQQVPAGTHATTSASDDDDEPQFNCFYQNALDRFDIELQRALKDTNTYINKGVPTYVPIDIPWALPTKSPATAEPAHFPTSIRNLLEYMLLVKGENKTYLNFKPVAIELFKTFDAETLQRMAAFIELVEHGEWVFAKALTAMIKICSLQRPGSSFKLDAMLITLARAWDSSYPDQVMMGLTDTAIQQALSIPHTVENIEHLIKHIRVDIKPSPQVKLSVTVTPCSQSGYTPKPTVATVDKFVYRKLNEPREVR